jgi:hypothetical protein
LGLTVFGPGDAPDQLEHTGYINPTSMWNGYVGKQFLTIYGTADESNPKRGGLFIETWVANPDSTRGGLMETGHDFYFLGESDGAPTIMSVFGNVVTAKTRGGAQRQFDTKSRKYF